MRSPAGPDPEQPVLEIEGLSHAFGRTAVLRDVGLQVEAGQLVSVLGPSGAGKTTLLRAVGGFLAPQAGSIRIAGEVANADGAIRVQAERRGLGIVFQDYALFGHMSVHDNVAFGLRRGGDRAARIDEVLALVGLTGLEWRRPAELSGGQQQRVALARALAPRPKLLLLDEPFANLDAALRHQLRDDLCRSLRASGTAALLITHDRTEALSIADQTVVLVPGPTGARVAQAGSPSSVYDLPATPEVARLTGHGTILDGQAEGEAAVTPLGALPIRAAHTGPVWVLVRPEQARFVAGEGPARVLSAQFLGATVTLLIQANGETLTVQTPARGAPAAGAGGSLVFDCPLVAWPAA